MKEKTGQPRGNIFEHLGQLVYEFKQLMLGMKVMIYTILAHQGLKDYTYARILLADQTAYPVLEKTHEYSCPALSGPSAYIVH